MSATNQNLPANELDSIIKEVFDYSRKNNDSEKKVVIIETKTGDIIEELPFWSRSGYRFFEINRQAVAFNVSGPEIEIRYSNSIHPFKIQIRYDARINDKSASRLVRLSSKS